MYRQILLHFLKSTCRMQPVNVTTTPNTLRFHGSLQISLFPLSCWFFSLYICLMGKSTLMFPSLLKVKLKVLRWQKGLSLNNVVCQLTRLDPVTPSFPLFFLRQSLPWQSSNIQVSPTPRLVSASVLSANMFFLHLQLNQAFNCLLVFIKILPFSLGAS